MIRTCPVDMIGHTRLTEGNDGNMYGRYDQVYVLAESEVSVITPGPSEVSG